MKRNIVLVLILALALATVLPVTAQNAPVVEYTFNGIELQKLENGVVVQTWTMPNTLETQQIVAVLQAESQVNDPTIRYTFDNDRMYLLRGDQVVGLWLLRGGRWIDEPALVVRYEYDGKDMRRFVNEQLQQRWTLPPGIQTYGFMTMMQAQANEQVASHISEELYVEQSIEHLPALLAKDFTLYNIPTDQSVDMSWYSPEFGESLASALAVDSQDPVVMAMENLVVIRHPVVKEPRFDLIYTPQSSSEPSANLYDLYRFQDGKVTEMWLGYDLPTLTQPVN